MATLAELQAQQVAITAQIAALDTVHMTAVTAALFTATDFITALQVALVAAIDGLADETAKKRCFDLNNVLSLSPKLIQEDAARIATLAAAVPAEDPA